MGMERYNIRGYNDKNEITVRPDAREQKCNFLIIVAIVERTKTVSLVQKRKGEQPLNNARSHTSGNPIENANGVITLPVDMNPQYYNVAALSAQGLSPHDPNCGNHSEV